MTKREMVRDGLFRDHERNNYEIARDLDVSKDHFAISDVSNRRRDREPLGDELGASSRWTTFPPEQAPTTHPAKT